MGLELDSELEDIHIGVELELELDLELVLEDRQVSVEDCRDSLHRAG